jgi:hypothetical protein
MQAGGKVKIFEIADVWVAAEDAKEAIIFYLDEVSDELPEEEVEAKEMSEKNLRVYEYYDEDDNCDEQKTFWDRLQEDIQSNKQTPYLFAREI